jgi:hypothetical protein
MLCPKCNARIGFFRTFGTSFPQSLECPSCNSVLKLKRVGLAFTIAFAICAILDVFLGLLPWYWTMIAVAISNLLIFYVVFQRMIELSASKT